MFYHVYVLFMSHGIYFTKTITCAEGILTPGRRSCLRLAYCTEFMCNSCRDIEWGIHFLTSCSICLPHNELPLCTPPSPPALPPPPLWLGALARSPLQILTAAPRQGHSRTCERKWQEIQSGQGSVCLQLRTNAPAINPRCRVDKLIACTAISTPVSNIKKEAFCESYCTTNGYCLPPAGGEDGDGGQENEGSSFGVV